MSKAKVAILGAGSWGTAVAIHLAKYNSQILLWAHQQSHVEDMAKNRRNLRYLPDFEFPNNLTPIADLSLAVTLADIVIIAVPSHAFAEVLQLMPKPKTGLGWLTKGLDPSSQKFLSELVEAQWGKSFATAVISGPSFAAEVARGLPTALTVAGHHADYLRRIRDILHHEKMRVYLSGDTIGVQLSGAVKNVLAIACGISDGLSFGANAKAALITRGLAEMRRLGKALHAEQETFMGLAGVGDLVLTCTDNQSRNRRFGLLIGQGKNLKDAEAQIGQVVEGKYNAAQVCALASRHQVEMPICLAVNALLNQQISPKEAVEELMSRPPKEESSPD